MLWRLPSCLTHRKGRDPSTAARNSRREFRTFAQDDKYFIGSGKWRVRAKSQWLTAKSCSNCHRPDFFFHLNCIHHPDGVPRTAIQKATVRTLAEALLAADAQDGIDCDAAKRRAVFVRHPEHAVFHRTIFHA